MADDELEFPWTGNRLVPDHIGDTAIEHLHRHAFAGDYVRGKDVLDIARGQGYGSYLLSNMAASVIGLTAEEAARSVVSEEVAVLRRRFVKLQRPHPNAQALALGIVTYNNPAAHLARLICSIELAESQLNNTQHAVRLYSIDCGSPAKWEPMGITHYCLDPKGNLGFGRGMNRLMATAFRDQQVSWFLCVNPDGILHRHLLSELLSCAEQYPDSLIEARQFPEEHPKPYDPDTGLTAWASGACLLIPRRIYEKIGGFDENIFMYMEDVDYSWRARSAGFAVRVAPRALFAHSVLDREPDPTIEKHYYLSARYLAHKWRRPSEQAFFERVMLDREYVTVLPPLPALDDLALQETLVTDVAEFEYGFAYAPLRWT